MGIYFVCLSEFIATDYVKNESEHQKIIEEITMVHG